jgi:hypothetical protein
MAVVIVEAEAEMLCCYGRHIISSYEQPGVKGGVGYGMIWV